MARPRKVIETKADRKRHEAALQKRRDKHAEVVLLRKAAQENEGDADFQHLVKLEKKKLGIVDDDGPSQLKGGKSSPKAITAAREHLSKAFDLMGGVAALVVWGRSNPTEFYRLWARLIPKESVEVSAQLPLEALLEKLSNKEGQSVSEAAWELGTEMLEQGRRQAAEEDAVGLPGPDDYIN